MDAKRDDGKAYSIAYVSAIASAKPEPKERYMSMFGPLNGNDYEDSACSKIFPAGQYSIDISASGSGTPPTEKHITAAAYYKEGSTMTFVGNFQGKNITKINGQFNYIRISNGDSYTYSNVSYWLYVY